MIIILNIIVISMLSPPLIYAENNVKNTGKEKNYFNIYILGELEKSIYDKLKENKFKLYIVKNIENININKIDILIINKKNIKYNLLEKIVFSKKVVIGLYESTDYIQHLSESFLAISAHSSTLRMLGLRITERIGKKYKGIIFGSNTVSPEVFLNAIKELTNTSNVKDTPQLKSQGWTIISSFIFEFHCRPYGNIYIKEYAYVNTNDVDQSHDYYLIKEKTTLISGSSEYGSRWQNAGVTSTYNVGRYTNVFEIGDFDPDHDMFNPSTITVTITFYPPSVSWTYNNNHDIWQVDLKVYSTTKIGWTQKFYLTSGEVTVKPGLGIVAEEGSAGRISITIKGIFAKRSGYAYEYHTCTYPFTMYLSKP